MRNLPSLKVDKAAGTTLTGHELLPQFDRSQEVLLTSGGRVKVMIARLIGLIVCCGEERSEHQGDTKLPSCRSKG